MTVVKASFVDGVRVPIGGGTITYTPVGLRATASDPTKTVAPIDIVAEVVAGVAQDKDLEPGPYAARIEVEWFLETYPIVVPDTGPEQLIDLIEDSTPYEPPVVSLVKQYRDQAQQASAIAVTAAEGVAGVGEDLEQIALDRAAAEAARDAAQGFAGSASESGGHAAVSAVSAGDSATLAGQRDTSAAGHASNASASATAAGQSESAAAQHEANAETAADLAVSTAAGIQDVAADAAQVALDRVAVADDRGVVALDRQAVDAAAAKAAEDASRGVFHEQVRNALSRRRERPIRLAVFSDSRGEGFTPTLTEGVQSWADTFPILVGRDLRTKLGVGAGGRGWVPLALTGSAAQYRFAVSEFISGGSDLVVGDTGVPGSQWMTEAKTIRIPLSAGCTSVAFVSAPSGGGGYATKLTGQKADRVREWGQDGTAGVLVDALNDPGTYVDVTSGGGGFFALGVIEYCGDESAGVQVLNFSVSGIDSVDMAANVVKPAMAALLDWYSADVSVVALGANDVDHGVGVADSTAAIESILSASGGAPVVMTAIAAGAVSPSWTALNAGIRAMSGVTVSDIAGLIPGSNSVNAEGLFLSDGTHLGLSGSGAFSDFLQGTMLGKPLAQAGQGAPGYVLPEGGVPAADLDGAVRASLNRADGSVQEGDSRLTNARPPTAHSHVVADVTGLQGALDGKAPTSHTHAEAQVTGLTAKLATKADLDGSGQILAVQIPAVALTDFLGAVGTQAAMLALAGQRGDWCTRTDRGTDWQLIAEPSSTLANWREKTYPASPVSSVNGRTGAVDTSSADITDATPVGRASMKAADQAAGRAAIGAAAAVHTHTIANVDGLQAALDAAGGPTSQAKMLAYCGGGSYTSSVPASGTATSFGARVPIMLPAATTRWRVKMRNYNGYTPANGAQPLSGSKLAIGKHALNTLGNSNGVFTSGTVRTVHNAAFTIPNTTTWWTSPWFTDPADQIPANEPYLFGWSATSTAQQLTAGVGEAWLFTGFGVDATDATKTNGTMGVGNSTQGCPLDIVIEYKCVSARPSILTVGDSIMEGLTGSTGTSFASCIPAPWYQSYPHQWANSSGAIAVNIAQWGTTTAQWLPTVTDRWSRADLSSGQFAGAIIALGSNDASNSVALATYQANMALIVGKVRSLIAAGAPIYLVNVIGRNFSGTPETMRVAYNDWLATCPLGVQGVIDAAGSMTTPGFTPTMMAHLSMDGIHPNMTGNAHLAGLVGSRVQL